MSGSEGGRGSIVSCINYLGMRGYGPDYWVLIAVSGTTWGSPGGSVKVYRYQDEWF